MSDCPTDPSRPELELVCRAAAAAEQAAAAATRLAERGSALGDWAGFIQALGVTLLPVAAVVLLWKLFGPISAIIESRRFTIKIGPFELSAQEAAEQLAKQVEDLQAKVVALEEAGRAAPAGAPAAGTPPATASPGAAAGDAPAAHPAARPAARALSLLWVDDLPQNNAFEIANLQGAGHAVVTARSTDEARAILRRGRIDVILSDMGRAEGRDAGLALLRALRSEGDRRPYGFYSSGGSLTRHRAEIEDLGAFVATSSYIDLRAAIDRIAQEETR